MKTMAKAIFVVLAGVCFSVVYAHAQAVAAGKLPAPAVFVASTPCSTGTKPLPGIPAEAGCELIKWELQLFGGTGEHDKGRYILHCEYGMPRQGTRGFINGGSRIDREGNWKMIKGTATDPTAVICRLDPEKPRASISFLRLNNNLLHLLDSDNRLMIGSGAWSYTLNRISK